MCRSAFFLLQRFCDLFATIPVTNEPRRRTEFVLVRSYIAIAILVFTHHGLLCVVPFPFILPSALSRLLRHYPSRE